MGRNNWRFAAVLGLWLMAALLAPALAQPGPAAPPPAPAMPTAQGTAELPAAQATPEAPAPRIGVVTMEPGEIFFERFGHNAIVVDDPASGRQTSYNFGYFDLDEPNFFANFIHGQMRYWLVALPLEQDMARYRQLGRGASLQWLDLTAEQARSLAEAVRITREAGASEVLTCVFAKKPWPLPRAPEPDFVGWEAPNRFLVGYGLDHAGTLRGLPDICALD